MNKNTSQGQIRHSLARFSCLPPGKYAGGISRVFWWINQDFISVDLS
jgi:hypothetical protein